LKLEFENKLAYQEVNPVILRFVAMIYE
jgi:hypothetical protein